MGNRVVVRRGDVVLHGEIVGPLREGGAVPGAPGGVISGTTIVRVDRADWPRIPASSSDVPGITLGTHGNRGGDLEFRDVIVRGEIEAEPQKGG